MMEITDYSVRQEGKRISLIQMTCRIENYLNIIICNANVKYFVKNYLMIDKKYTHEDLLYIKLFYSYYFISSIKLSNT